MPKDGGVIQKSLVGNIDVECDPATSSIGHGLVEDRAMSSIVATETTLVTGISVATETKLAVGALLVPTTATGCPLDGTGWPDC